MPRGNAPVFRWAVMAESHSVSRDCAEKEKARVLYGEGAKRGEPLGGLGGTPQRVGAAGALCCVMCVPLVPEGSEG